MIGIYDSGVGGLSVLREVCKRLPRERIVYYSDNAFCPYGGRDPQFIRSRAFAVTEELIGLGADILVVACNTATTVAINALRNHFAIPFVGLEPAVKPAAAETATGVIGVLATAATLASSKYRATRDSLPHGIKVIECVGEGFVELVEKGILDGPQAEETVSRALTPMLGSSVDAIALGCTHYPFLRSTIERMAPGVTVIDPSPSVARHLEAVMSSRKLLRRDAAAFPDVSLHSSGSDANLIRTYNTLVLPELSSLKL